MHNIKTRQLSLHEEIESNVESGTCKPFGKITNLNRMPLKSFTRYSERVVVPLFRDTCPKGTVQRSHVKLVMGEKNKRYAQNLVRRFRVCCGIAAWLSARQNVIKGNDLPVQQCRYHGFSSISTPAAAVVFQKPCFCKVLHL